MRTIKKEILDFILLEIINKKSIKQLDVAMKYGITERSARRYFKILKDEGIIVLKKDGNKAYWRLK